MLAGGERFVVEKEGLASNAIGADDALVFSDGKKHRRGSVVGRQCGENPFVAEVFAEDTLLDGAGRGDGGGKGQLLGAIRALGGDSGNVQHTGQFSEGVKDGGACASEFAVARAIVLAAVDEKWTLFGYTGADAVGAFDLLGPDAAEPDAPTLEMVGAGFVAAMVNRHSGAVTEKDDVALLADDGIQAIDLFPGVNDDVGDRLFGGV